MSQRNETATERHFSFSFEDEGEKRITFDYSPDFDEQLSTAMESGRTLLTLNRSGCVALAKVLIKLGLGCHPNGYRVYVREHFDGNREDVLVIQLLEEPSVRSDE